MIHSKWSGRCVATSLLMIAAMAHAEEPVVVREVSIDPNSPDVIGQLRQIGLPKYTEGQRRILERANRMQAAFAELFQRIEVGKSVFEYEGLIAEGENTFHLENGVATYALKFGIRPHIHEFESSFGEYLIRFNGKGIIVGKEKVTYEWNETDSK